MIIIMITTAATAATIQFLIHLQISAHLPYSLVLCLSVMRDIWRSVWSITPHTMWVVKTVVYRCVSLRENSSSQAGSAGTIGKSLWICTCSNRWKQGRQMCSSVQTVLSYLKYRTYWGTVCITVQTPITVYSFPYQITQEMHSNLQAQHWSAFE